MSGSICKIEPDTQVTQHATTGIDPLTGIEPVAHNSSTDSNQLSSNPKISITINARHPFTNIENTYLYCISDLYNVQICEASINYLTLLHFNFVGFCQFCVVVTSTLEKFSQLMAITGNLEFIHTVL